MTDATETAAAATAITPPAKPEPRSALGSLAAGRRAILDWLKRHGEADVAAIAAGVGITASGVRQLLVALTRDGLVVHRRAPAAAAPPTGPGRPRHRYALTPAGDALFPRAYGDLANEILDYVEDEDPALLERLFDRRARRRLIRADARTGDLPFADRVAIVAGILDEDGYLADFAPQPDGSFLVTEHNCAVLAVAQRHHHACSSELDFLRAALPDAQIERVAHRIAGAHVCAYSVRPKD